MNLRICNAQGEQIYIEEDNPDNVIGLADYKKLMENIPNKIKQLH
jgi:ATP-dependent DNA helicase RecG